MEYIYNVVECAALWAGIDPGIIRKRMDAADLAKIEEEYEEYRRDYLAGWGADISLWVQMREECTQCAKEESCPEFVWKQAEGGGEVAVLQCPLGFKYKPGKDEPLPRAGMPDKPVLVKRLLPHVSEFSDLPDFECRLMMLQRALAGGYLLGVEEEVSVHDLRTWMLQNLPDQKPEFLFSSGSLRPQTEGEKSASRVVKNVMLNNKPRLITPIIENLIKELDSDQPSVIFPVLREMALNEAPPFKMVDDSGALLWTNGEGVVDKVTYASLSKILLRHRKKVEGHMAANQMHNDE